MTENKPHVLSTNNDVFDLRYHLLNIKTITDNTKEVTSLLVLLDKRIASSSMDGTIHIYNPSKDFNCDIVITTDVKSITSLCQLPNGHIVASCYTSIFIFSISQLSHELISSYKGHTNTINKVLSLSNNRFASCSDDLTIKIWDTVKYSSPPLAVMKINYNNKSMLYLKEKEMLISLTNGTEIYIWSTVSYQLITTIKYDNWLCSGIF